MGDGGVACMSLQRSNNIMERFPVQEKTTVVAPTTTSTAATTTTTTKNHENDNKGSSTSNITSNNGSNGNGTSNGINLKPKRVVKKIIKVKKVVPVKKSAAKVAEKKEVGQAKGTKSGTEVDKKELKSSNGKEAEKKEVKTSNGKETEKKEVKTSKGKEAEKKEVKTSNGKEAEKKEVKSGCSKEADKKEVKSSNVKEAKKKEVKSSDCKEAEKKETKGGKDVDKTESKEVQKSELGLSSADNKVVQHNDSNDKEEVEEGELGTLKWPTTAEVENWNFVRPEKSRRSEIEKGEIVVEKWSKGDVEKEAIASISKWRKWEFARDEIEKGEFIPGRSHNRDDYSKSRGRYDTISDRTPPSGKYSSVDVCKRKEFDRIGCNQHSKSSSLWEIGRDRNVRLSSKILGEEDLYKFEYSNGKIHGKDYVSGNRLNRHCSDFESNERKYYGEHGKYTGSKSRRLSEDSSRSAHSEHYSRHSVERFYRNSSSSRLPSVDKYSTRHNETILSSKVVYDRLGWSPGNSERSPRDRSRCYGRRDKTPVHGDRSPNARERSPYVLESSPYARSPYGRDRLPYGRDESPYGRGRSPYKQERSPCRRERSPYERSRRYDNKNRSPPHCERSLKDRACRDCTPKRMEHSPHDRARSNINKESNRKGGVSEKRSPVLANKGHDDKLVQRISNVKDSELVAKESEDRSSMHNSNAVDEKNAICMSHKEEQPQNLIADRMESSQAYEPPAEELLSMEEDMDICDTPPHVPIVTDSSAGKWFYLDHFGVEHGPSRLCDLKALVDEGVLVSDHFIRRLDSDRWLTIENAVSPLVTVSFPSIVSDTDTQLVSPPEAPGNLLADNGDMGHSCVPTGEEPPITSFHLLGYPDDGAAASEPLEDSHIDKRVESLMEGVTILPGNELETIGGILQTTFEYVKFEQWEEREGPTQALVAKHHDHIVDELPRCSDLKIKEVMEGRLVALSDKDLLASSVDSADWSGRWSCKGGDWKRNENAVQDKVSKRKLVLNDGLPLCQMPKFISEDPRWHKKDDLYHPSQRKRLELPPWAFSCSDDKNEGGDSSRFTLSKPPIPRGVNGTALSVVRINACVVKDHGSIISETRKKVRGKERNNSMSARTCASTNDMKRSSTEGEDLKFVTDSDGSCKSTATINIPKDRLCTLDDLQLHLGDPYCLDASGHENVSLPFLELQIPADQGTIKKGSSIFKKFDGALVPATSDAGCSEAIATIELADATSSVTSLGSAPINESCTTSNLFDSLHPQFIGYTCGKLHELVMKSYKSREFAAAINEVLDPWINAKQPKKDVDKQTYWKSEIEARAGKRTRMQIDESDMVSELEEDLQTVEKVDTTFEQLCGNATFPREQGSCETGLGSWGLLDGHMLARIFHCLRSDVKSLALASLTCKHWRAAVNFYRHVSNQVNLSSIGPKCTDSIIQNIMNGYNKRKIQSLVMFGCTNITPGMLEEILRTFPCLSSIDIRRCSQFMQLELQFPNVNWLKSRTRTSEESGSKIRSLKQINDKTKGLGNDVDDFGELREYFDSVNKRDSTNQLFHRSLYKRSKLFDARKSSSIVSRDARMRRWAIKKTENGYRRMEGFLTLALKDIMKENTFDFFVPKVAEIENRMKNGYYIVHGLRSLKEDISRMCRHAIKAKNCGAGDMNCIITLFLQLVTRLEESSKFLYERDELMKSWKDDFVAVLGSTPMKCKKKSISERKVLHRSNGTAPANGSFGFGGYASDREIRRRLSKLNRKSLDSGSETSENCDRFSEDGRSDHDSTLSDTENDLDGWIGESRRDGYFLEDECLDTVVDEREWGARMTKASLVPPVTRKYEVIDHYVIVADEEDVKRKMSVSLPDDYTEKLDAQRDGSEELDMELPEVKDYRPRKQLGDEVIEQEVYGIDPYTHNLILDSMPEEVDCSQLEKHLFIEDVLLRTLNKQVRYYTGTGNTPMMYHLQPIIEEIEQAAAEDCDRRTMKICQGILKAIDSRPDDNYVAYRKGLGVVCNKESGFGVEDFVVEFLGEVYPAWKWFEKQDGIRSLQKDSQDPAPEFYNIYLERPKGDADGYDLVVVDAMHKANYASRICHSCKPNCEAKVTAVDGQYQIGIYSVREIQYGEEITFDYNSVTESKEEYEASVCLCGSQVCRGSYLNLTGEGAFQKVLKEWHGILNRHHLMLEACQLNSVTEDDYLDLGGAGLGSCLLGGLPDWVVAYSARLVRFINLERTKLPEEILSNNLEEKRKYFSEISLDVERSDAEVQAEGVYNQRLQNLAVTLDKVRYVMRCVFGDPKKAPPPLERLSPEEIVSFLWKGDGSLVEELLQCMGPHVEADVLHNLKSKILLHDPSDSDDLLRELHNSLLWLRDEVRNLPCTYKCRHDAAADLIHMYAYTKNFFRVLEYNAFTSPPVHISPLDLGPEYAEKLGAGIHEYRKTYDGNYCMGQLIFWHLQTNAEPDVSLAKANRGCLSLPEISSFYANVQKPSRQHIYGPKIVKIMLERMERYPQKPWPKDHIWSFKSSPKINGSPMLDAVLDNSPLDKEMLYWLKQTHGIPGHVR